MKVDLHLHTPASILNGDSINWDSDSSTVRKLWSNDIKAFAFTDHNIFDSKLYLNVKRMCKGKLFVFPGVEINIIKQDGVIAHLLLIFDHQINDEQILKLEELCRLNLRKRGISIEKAYEVFNEYEFIAIPHVGKGDYFKIDELNFEHHAIEITSHKNANYKRWQKSLNNKSVVAFSDTHIWRDYPQNDDLRTMIDFDGSLKDLKEKLSLNKDYTI